MRYQPSPMLNTFVRRLTRLAKAGLAPCLLVPLTTSAALGMTVPARGGEAVVIGELMCHWGNAGRDEIERVVQTRDIVCLYQPADGGIDESYIGTLSVISRDDQLNNQKVFAWTIRGPIGAGIRPGLLAQTYTVGGDGETPSLIGNTENSISLWSLAPGDSSSTPMPFIEDMWLELHIAPA